MEFNILFGTSPGVTCWHLGDALADGPYMAEVSPEVVLVWR